MLDPCLRRLLEEAVNTSCKLTLVMLYAEQPDISATPEQISQRLCRDVWSVEQALRELEDDGILVCCKEEYRYLPTGEHGAELAQLLDAYDEPLRRQEIMRIVDDLDRYAPYREMLEHQAVTIVSS